MKPFIALINRLRVFLTGGRKKQADIDVDNRDISEREHDFKQIDLVPGLEENLRLIAELTGKSTDIAIKRCFAGPDEVPCAIIFVDGLVNRATVAELMRIVAVDTHKIDLKGLDQNNIYNALKKRLLTLGLTEAESMDALYEGISFGATALLFDGTAKAILMDTRGWINRTLEEPDSEIAIRGPRDGFVETLRFNTSLLRRRIRSPNLWIESLQVGSITRTDLALAYIKGLAGEEMLGELRSRLKRIDIDGVLESGVVEEFIRDAPFSVFPTILRTERPDRVAGAILEGRVAVFTNGTPFVLVLPADLPMFLQAPDDYNEVFPIGSFIRLLRFAAFAIAIFLPGIYVSVLNFHPELLPLSLLLTIQTAREGVPFPVVAEVLFMEATFEILREAGLRLPRAIGPAISIVGALILGDAAIRAGLVSPGVVIIVAFTAIASFSAPIFSIAIAGRLLRFVVIILAALLGLFGVQFALLALIIHLVSLRSFGHPYLAPYGPFIWQDMKDSILRLSWWQQMQRPKLLGYREPGRQRPGQMPRPGKRNRPGKKGEGN